MRRLWRFTNRAQRQARACLEQEPRDGAAQQQAEIDHPVVREQGRADERNRLQPRDAVRLRRQRHADKALAHEGRQPGAEDRQGEARGDLIGDQHQRQPGKQRSHHHAGNRAGRKTQQRNLRLVADHEASHGGHQHHALGAQV